MGESLGDVWTALSDDPLPIQAVHDFLRDERAGGLCVFVGTTRRWTGDVETSALDYHAYRSMAAASLRRLAERACASGALRVAVLHRLGVVPLQEASVVIGVATPHRAAAFDLTRRLIDDLKADTPIWKRDLDPHA